jgi:hypothetical protein
MEDYLTLQGVSHLTGKEKLKRAFREWLEVDDG